MSTGALSRPICIMPTQLAFRCRPMRPNHLSQSPASGALLYRAQAELKKQLFGLFLPCKFRTRTRTNTHPYGNGKLYASPSGRGEGFRAARAGTKNEGPRDPLIPLQHANRLPLRWFVAFPVKRNWLFFFLHLHMFLHSSHSPAGIFIVVHDRFWG